MQCTPRSPNGFNHLGLCAFQVFLWFYGPVTSGYERPTGEGKLRYRPKELFILQESFTTVWSSVSNRKNMMGYIRNKLNAMCGTSLDIPLVPFPLDVSMPARTLASRAEWHAGQVSSIWPNQPQVLHTSTAKFTDKTCLMPARSRCGCRTCWRCATPQHGLSSNKMALITSDCSETRSPSIKWP